MKRIPINSTTEAEVTVMSNSAKIRLIYMGGLVAKAHVDATQLKSNAWVKQTIDRLMVEVGLR